MSSALSKISCVMFQMAPDYDHLTLMEKVEVFEHAVNNTAGDDLAKLLWLKSPSSEVCFFPLLIHSRNFLNNHNNPAKMIRELFTASRVFTFT